MKIIFDPERANEVAKLFLVPEKAESAKKEVKFDSERANKAAELIKDEDDK